MNPMSIERHEATSSSPAAHVLAETLNSEGDAGEVDGVVKLKITGRHKPFETYLSVAAGEKLERNLGCALELARRAKGAA